MLVCVEHGRALECERNSYYLEEVLVEPEDHPYRIWSTDLWQCPYPFCGVSIAVTAEQPVTEFDFPGYEETKRNLNVTDRFRQ